MKHIFKSIIRSFLRKPVTNLINLLGLTISFTLVIILSAYCYSELTTDNFHKNGDNVFLYLPSDDRIYTPGILKENIDMKVPGVESAIRIAGTWEAPVFQVNDKEPITSDLLFADKDFFDFFSYNIVEGDPYSALNEPLTVVITKTLSDKLFGEDDPVGKTIKLNSDKELLVRAVIKEPETNSCLSFSAVTSIASQKIIQGENGEYTEWGWCDFQTFLLLNKGNDPAETQKIIHDIIPADFQNEYSNAKLIPLKKIYFSKFTLLGGNYLKSGNKKQVLILVMVALLVLIIALVNFINISTSQWQAKIKQTGIKKIVGARRHQIMLDILFESFLFFLVALIIAIELVNSIKPFITDYIGIHFNQKLIYSPGFITFSLTSILFLSFIFSIFPALRISSSRAADNLKNTVNQVKTNFSARGILVTMQFAIAIVLIAFTLLVQKQVRFGSTNLGINQDNILGIRLTGQLYEKKEVLKDMLEKESAVRQISFSQYYPGKIISSWGSVLILNGENKQVNFDTFSADAEFFKMLGLQLVSGRFYSDDLATDKGKIMVNESFLKQQNITDAIGGIIIHGMEGKVNLCEIIGIVRDFHYKSVNQPIAPLAIRNDPAASHCMVSLQTRDFKSLNRTVQNIKKMTSELSPSFPVEVSFFDQAVQNMYKSELYFHNTFSLLGGCAIVICCLGILAMSLFTCQHRIKEIGIRKVNGARISEILAMLNKDFVKWVVIAFIIASPVAWFVMNRWLRNFAYKTDLSWWIYALAGIFALGIALLTVSWQSWRAATRNPVESLRYE